MLQELIGGSALRARPNPATPRFIVKTTGPPPVGTVALGLIPENFLGSIRVNLATEHHSRIRRPFRQMNVNAEAKIGVLLFCDKKELFIGEQMDFTVHNFCFAMWVRISPSG